MKIKIDLSKEKSFFNKIKLIIVDFITKLLQPILKNSYERYKVNREKNELCENFEKRFNVKVFKIREIIKETSKDITSHELRTNDLIDSAKKYNTLKKYKSPSFVEPEIIDIHNEHCHLNTLNIEMVKLNENESDKEKLFKQDTSKKSTLRFGDIKNKMLKR